VLRARNEQAKQVLATALRRAKQRSDLSAAPHGSHQGWINTKGQIVRTTARTAPSTYMYTAVV
jgi:hypothetical protein